MWLMNRNIKTALTRRSDQGFALPVAVGTGLVMLLVAATLISRSQGDQITASARKGTGGSLAAAEGGTARTLAQLTQPNNAGLLTRNYDPINSDTGKTYLGADGVLDNGDEESTAVDEWTSFASGSPSCTSGATPPPSITYSGTIGTNDKYTLRAYRYRSDPGPDGVPDNLDDIETGTFLVEGQQGTSASLSHIAVTVSIDPTTGDFPGVLAVETMQLSRRSVLGNNGNVYYDPASSANTSLKGSAAVGDANRPNYLNAIGSGPSDNVSGKILACQLTPTLSDSVPSGATYLGGGAGVDIKDSTTETISGTSGDITHYQAHNLVISSKTIDVDTTNGPVYLYVTDNLKVQGTAKIRNIRTDGVPPRVGDLRIILTKINKKIKIDGSGCIETAFVYARQGQLNIQSTGDGCPSSGNTNIDGVVWAKKIINDTNITSAGIAVPDDLSSLSDIAASIVLPTRNKFGAVKSWQRQKL